MEINSGSVMEQADIRDLKSRGLNARAGSTPAAPTTLIPG